jgi:transcriptional regulator with XRE-family HTH domain
MSITIRIKDILEKKDLNPAQFADQLNINRSRLSHVLTGRNNPSLEIVQAILDNYPDINPMWLLSGKGKMTKNDILNDPAPAEKSQGVDLFNYTSSVKEISKQKSETESRETEAPENIKNEKNHELTKENETSANVIKALSHGKRPGIKMITVFYDNNEYEVLYPEGK